MPLAPVDTVGRESEERVRVWESVRQYCVAQPSGGRPAEDARRKVKNLILQA